MSSLIFYCVILIMKFIISLVYKLFLRLLLILIIHFFFLITYLLLFLFLLKIYVVRVIFNISIFDFKCWEPYINFIIDTYLFILFQAFLWGILIMQKFIFWKTSFWMVFFFYFSLRSLLNISWASSFIN